MTATACCSRRFTASLDVIGHELTHGVTQYEANLVYSGQSGALNESISDVFGSLVRQYKLNQTAKQADWLIGPDCVGDKLKPALRSMKAPGTANQYDDQPADMDHYVRTTEDHGGVHTNSGIPNLAFATAAMALGGKAWEKAGADLVRGAARSPHPAEQRLPLVRQRHVRQAGQLYGSASKEVPAVRSGWAKVKVSSVTVTRLARSLRADRRLRRAQAGGRRRHRKRCRRTEAQALDAKVDAAHGRASRASPATTRSSATTSSTR